VWFNFQDDANGPATQIVYFNGRRVAMGDDLEPIILFDPAKPGDKILVAVKLLQTVDEKHFTAPTCESHLQKRVQIQPTFFKRWEVFQFWRPMRVRLLRRCTPLSQLRGRS